ncbi:hypothetical protein V6N13_009996 [Hibiscus sabdariffa]
MFPSASVEFLLPDCSDHCSSHLILKTPLFRPPKPFKLSDFWVEHPGFLKIVEDSWVQPAGGNPLQLLFTKLKRLKGPLKQFNKGVFGDISARVQAHQVELDNLQKKLLLNPNANNLMREMIVAKELHDHYRVEEQFLDISQRIQCIRKGDQNSGFFLQTSGCQTEI